MKKESTFSDGGNSLPNKQTSNEEKTDTRLKRARRFFELAKTMYGEKKTVNDLISEMTPETAIKILRHLNAKLLGLAGKSEIAYSKQLGRMTINVGQTNGQREHIAPEPVLQMDLFRKYLDAIKEISEKEKRASLAYFGLNCLHLFNDGNGRTSRAVYELIMEDKLPRDIEDVFIHKTNDERNIGKEKFESKTSIHPVKEAVIIANLMLQTKLLKSKSGERLDEKYRDTFFSIKSVISSDKVEFYIPKRIEDELSEEESFELHADFSDGIKGYGYSTLAGLTLAVVLQNKNTIDEIVKENIEENDNNSIYVAFCVNYSQESNNESKNRAKRIFQGWEAEDYREIIKTYKSLKEQQNLAIISIFRDKDKKMLSDWLMGKNTANW